MYWNYAKWMFDGDTIIHVYKALRSYLCPANIFLKWFIFIFKLCVSPCKCSAWGGLKRASEAQELELQVVVSLLLRMLCEQSATPLQSSTQLPPTLEG